MLDFPLEMSVNVRLRVLMLLVIVAVASYAQSTWTFTPEQVAAGRAAFEQNCAACHGANLRQLPESLLAGREFSAKWGSRGTNELIATDAHVDAADQSRRPARGHLCGHRRVPAAVQRRLPLTARR